MNGKKILCAVAAVFWLAALQAAFFWLTDMERECAVVVYCFYTALSLGHVAFLFVAGDKLGMRAAIAPVLIGSVIAVGQAVMSLCFVYFGVPFRQALFAEMIVAFAYIAVVSIVTSASYDDSPGRGSDREPIRPFDDNPDRSICAPEPWRDPAANISPAAIRPTNTRTPRAHD